MKISTYGCECVENHVLNIEGHSILLLDEEVEVFSLSIDGVNMLISARRNVASDKLKSHRPASSNTFDALLVCFSRGQSNRFVSLVANDDNRAQAIGDFMHTFVVEFCQVLAQSSSGFGEEVRHVFVEGLGYVLQLKEVIHKFRSLGSQLHK